VTLTTGWGPGRARIRRSQLGQTLLEVALMLPFLLLLLVGVIELGRYAYIGVLVGNAAHAGAVFGAQNLAQSVNTAAIQTAATNDFNDNTQDTKNLKLTSVTATVACGCDSGGTVTTAACTGGTAGTCGTGHWVVTLTVTATGTFNSLFKYPGIPASLTVSRTSTMRVENVVELRNIHGTAYHGPLLRKS
jgi:Flp pilus assembly protein TadG